MTKWTVMERDQKTGLSIEYSVVEARSAAAAKSKFHIESGIYDSSKVSYWVNSSTGRAPAF